MLSMSSVGRTQGSKRDQVRVVAQAIAYAWFAQEVVQEKRYGCIAFCRDNCGSQSGTRRRGGKIEVVGALHRSERQRNSRVPFRPENAASVQSPIALR